MPFDQEVAIREGFYLLEPLMRPAHPDAAAFMRWLIEEAATRP
jgi:hypothetical protein